MEYARIIAITGLPGLFELISSKSDGGIVRSLDDKSTRFVSSRVHQFSHLESIEVYTTRYNVNLVEVLQAMGNSAEAVPDGKDAEELKSYFEKVYPDLDHSRVYSSDLKKMVKWFGVLKANDVEIKVSEPEAVDTDEDMTETDEGETSVPDAEQSPKKTKPAAATEKTESKKTAVPARDDEGAKKEPPAKKAASKLKDEASDAKKAAPKKTASKEKDTDKDTKEEKKPAAKAAPKKSAGKK